MAGGFADKKALVLFSGGQDSTTCLAWALKNFKEVETVGFDYGQRHMAEITCRKRILETIEDVLPYARGTPRSGSHDRHEGAGPDFGMLSDA